MTQRQDAVKVICCFVTPVGLRSAGYRGWMLPMDQYLSHLDADAHLLAAAAARGLEATVPGCPDWSVADLVVHVAAVHSRTSDIVEQNLIASWPAQAQLPEGGDPLQWYRAAANRLSRILAGADPARPAKAFVDEQTVGFWIRRMAHETAVHRIDAEQAHGYESTFDPELAVDGIAEVFDAFVTRIAGWGEYIPSGDVIRIQSGWQVWTVDLGHFVGSRGDRDYRIPKAKSIPDAEPTAVLSGEPDRVLLWMWGRAPLHDVTVSGQIELAHQLRKVCSI